MNFRKNIRASTMIVMIAGFMACGRTDNNPASQNSHSTTVSSADSGLASAANRKAIIAELGKNYQKSASGQYRKRIDTIAPFNIQLINNKKFTYKDLPAATPVTLIYFSPDCEECKTFTRAIIKRIGDFKGRQLVFITYEELAHVRTFYEQMGLKQYPQLKIGTEGYSFTVQKYYKVEHFPFIASYDKSGHLIKIYANSTQPEKLAAEI